MISNFDSVDNLKWGGCRCGLVVELRIGNRKVPSSNPRPGRKKFFLLELLLIRQWGSLAGPCNPMRLGHDGCTLVRSEVSCIRKGKNEAIQGWISHLSLERQAFYSLPFPPLLATSTGIDGGGVTGGVVLHSTLSFPPSFRHRSLKDRPTWLCLG